MDSILEIFSYSFIVEQLASWYMYLRYTIQCFEICSHCEMISTLRIVNIFITSHSHFFLHV